MRQKSFEDLIIGCIIAVICTVFLTACGSGTKEPEVWEPIDMAAMIYDIPYSLTNVTKDISEVEVAPDTFDANKDNIFFFFKTEEGGVRTQDFDSKKIALSFEMRIGNVLRIGEDAHILQTQSNINGYEIVKSFCINIPSSVSLSDIEPSFRHVNVFSDYSIAIGGALFQSNCITFYPDKVKVVDDSKSPEGMIRVYSEFYSKESAESTAIQEKVSSIVTSGVDSAIYQPVSLIFTDGAMTGTGNDLNNIQIESYQISRFVLVYDVPDDTYLPDLIIQ